MKFLRNCVCGRQIEYKTKYTFEKAISNNSICFSCRSSKNNKSLKRNVKKQNNPSWQGFKDVPGKVFSRLKKGAQTRNINFDITIEDIQNQLEKQNYICALTGISVDFFSNASVDRIDSSLGYNKTNIQIVDKAINMLKRDLPQDVFVELCKKVVCCMVK